MMLSVPRAQHFPQILPQVGKANAQLAVLNHTDYNSKFFNSGSVECLKLQLSPKRVQARWGKAGPRACAAAAEGGNLGCESVHSKGDTFFLRDLQFKNFPWAKFTTKLMLHTADAVWFLGKWLAVPGLIFMAIRDVILAVASENELWIPIGLLAGTLFTGILRETFSTLGIDFQDSVLPWHLVNLGLFLVIVKVGASNIVPFWFRAFLLHFTTGGLWQTVRFSLEWKAKKVNNGSRQSNQ